MACRWQTGSEEPLHSGPWRSASLWVYQHRSGNHFDMFLSKAFKTKQSISCSPADAKTEKLSVFTLGRKTIYYSKPYIVSVSSIRHLLVRSTCTLCSLFSMLRHPLPSRIIPIPAQNSLCCKFGSLISCCLKYHQILTKNADFFHEINQIFLRLLHALR